jgi:probable addiction module antidote protein
LGVVVKAIGVAKVSGQIGLTREGLYKSLGKSGNPEFATIMRIVRALGLTLSVKPTAGRKGKRRKVA